MIMLQSRQALELSRRQAVICTPIVLAGRAARADPLENRPYAPMDALLPITNQRLLLKGALSFVESCEVGCDLLPVREILADPEARRMNPDQLSGTSIRASCNIYTANLRFGDTYVLTASPGERSRMIRNDALPDVKTVITADLDLRDLYRNQAQTKVEEAQYELYRSNPDIAELRVLLFDAMDAMDQWFALIASNDVSMAEEEVTHLRERGKTVDIPSPRRF